MGTPRNVRGGGWRKSGLRATVVALAALALFVGQQMPAAADDPLQDALRRKEELERAVARSRQNAERYKVAASQFQAAVDSANARIADLADKQASAQTEAESLGFEIQITEEQLALVAFQLDETKALADSLNAQAAEQQRQLLRREDIYAKHLVATYRQALISPLEMLLSSRTLTEFANRVQQMIFVNRQDQQLANEIRTLRADTAAKLEDASGKEKEILGLQEQIATQRKALAEQKAKYEELVAQMQTAIEQSDAERAYAAANKSQAVGALSAANRETSDLNRKLEDAERQYANLAAQLAAKSGLGAFNGSKLAMWPLIGQITSGFGPRWGGFHNGLDIAAPKYTPIRAASSGQVVTVGRPYIAYGDTAVVVIIAHGYNFSTLYGHLDDLKWPPVRVGQFVAAGTIIGYVGMTGWTTGPHCHFMTIVNGKAVNPRPYLP
ncbi:MAG TPA: peptidoglycan DD-metalloendopeptidase family protein [Candidatus Limnocylindria bacterium]|jgi:murein DD-endopeptidase MepM/ murein hydrolase activator NlpD|nr:peptidoglycan DD-metalloendopeptidase family protein [Candidatus Limnocylindria bacterium]